MPKALPFTPVPTRTRRDGWTPDVQRAFIAALVRTRHIEKSCAIVGRSPASAYALRKRAGAEGFVRAWDAAFALTVAPSQPEFSFRRYVALCRRFPALNPLVNEAFL